MIVIAGIPSERPMELVINAAEDMGVPYFVINQRDTHSMDFEVEYRAGKAHVRLYRHSQKRELNEVHGAFLRLMDHRELPEFSRQRYPDCAANARTTAFHAILSDWLEMTGAKVMNRLRPCNTNMSKPYQLQLIARLGFAVPPTIITNQPENVRSFRKRHGRVIFKSISAHRSIVRELVDADEDRLERIRTLPTQFQALIEGDDVRVHAVGGKLFATRIKSDMVDYRYAESQGGEAIFEPTELPDTIARRCIELSRFLDLPLCGIDLKLAPDGTFYCFEVNPSPAFSYYQEQTDQPIARAIVRELAAA